MSTSSRKKAIELWQTDIPEGDKEKIAKTLFCFENPPGTAYISGSQDALGITMPGLNRFYYDKGYWPVQIEQILEADILSWIEKHIWLIPLYPRRSEYNVLANTNITEEGAKKLAEAAEECWTACKHKDTHAAGAAMKRSFEAQVNMFPHMLSEDIAKQIESYKDKALGWKISGAGGGGYLILFAEEPIKNAIQIKIRR